MSDASPLLLAVYGLLRPGLSGWRRFDLNRRTIHLGACRISGRLVDCGGYPGLVAGQGAVVADLLALTDRGLIAELDNFEDYRPDDPRRSEYIRREARLIGKTVDAQSYFYARAFDNLPIVAGGDWLRHAGKTGAREG